MELRNMFLWAALAFILMLIYEQWQTDFGPKPKPATVATQKSDKNDTPSAIPSAPADTPSAPAADSGDKPAHSAAKPLPSAQRIHVKTDVLDIDIDTVGGDLRKAWLPGYPVSVDKPNEPTELLVDHGPHTFIAQSGLVSVAKSDSPVPDHHTVYTAQKTEYDLQPGQDDIHVVLSWQGKDGIKVNKIYTFKRGSYVVGIRYEVDNSGSRPWKAFMYRQLQHSKEVRKSGLGVLPIYTGAVYSGFDKSKDEKVSYQKYKFSDMEDKNLNVTLEGGWAAMIQHYFIVAMIPGQEQSNRFYSLKTEGDRFAIGMIDAKDHELAPGQKTSFGYQMFIGPKVQKLLAKAAPGLELTVDYGYTTIVAQPLFWVLSKIHALVGNWGWAIILMTILLKGAFFKLQAKSYLSMAKMRKLNPRIQQLKERFGDNKQGFQQAMMELWKKEKVNPFGGCLPILIQMPIFLSFYWVLLESVELRQADWILWYHDLSQKDPYYVLPILNGISMFISFKLNPAPTDPMQAKIMQFMPIFVSVLFLFFPAGLVLYWTVNGILQNVQQYYITRHVVKAD